MLRMDRLTNSAHDINKGQIWPLPLVLYNVYRCSLSFVIPLMIKIGSSGLETSMASFNGRRGVCLEL